MHNKCVCKGKPAMAAFYFWTKPPINNTQCANTPAHPGVQTLKHCKKLQILILTQSKSKMQ